MDGGIGSSASSSVVDRRRGARWDPLLEYLTAAGLCERQLRDVEDMLVDISLGDIQISICRLDGGSHDLTISCCATAAGLKKRLAGEWSMHTSSLQLVIGSTSLCDSDVIAEFVSSTDRVVTAVVCGPRALQDRDQSTQENDKIPEQLEAVARYMDEGQYQHLSMLWGQSFQLARESCQAAAFALARLSDGSVVLGGDRVTRETMKDARRLIRDVLVKRVEGWQVVRTLDRDKMRHVFQKLVSEAGCGDSTVSQLMNSITRLAEEQYQQHAVRRVRRPTGGEIWNVVGGPPRG
jgi:hypothetical protein